MPTGSDLTLFTLAIEGVDADISVAEFEGTEGISELFVFQLDITSSDPALDPDAIVGSKASLTLATEGQAPRYVSGIVSRFELGEQTDKTAVYRVTLVPSMFRMLYRHDSRIFQEMRVDEIIQAVFGEAGVENFRLALHETYLTREYCVQYRESDWAFVSRLMEDEGIFYFFEHEEGAHTLVLADTHAAHAPIPAPDKIPFRPPLGAMARGESISRFVFGRELRAGKVAVTDFNFKKPMLSLMSTAAGDADVDLEVYDYPGKFDLPDTGSTSANVRLGEWEASRRWGGGDGGSARFAPGYLFELVEHPRGASNRAYLITRVHHHGAQPQMGDTRDITQSYRNRFEVIQDDVQFRPPRRTPRPVVRGVQTAIVTGPSGEEVYVDEHGRVKVQFHWDRKGKKDEKSSCWIRVSQAWAGPGWGAMVIPRIGHEVIVDFIEGDPDRPIITGRVYHGMNVPPYPLPAEKTKSSLRSSSSPGGNGSNEIRFEDKAGSEEIFLHGEKDWNIIIENDKTQSVGHDEELEVGHDRKKKVARNQSEDVGKDKSINVGGNHIETIAANEAQTIGANATKTVGGAFVAAIGAAASVSVGAAVTVNVAGKLAEAVGGNQEVTVGGSASESVSGDKKVSVAGAYNIDVSKARTAQITGDDALTVGGKQDIEVAEKITITCGDAKVVIDKSGDITVVGKEIKVDGSTNIIVKAGSKVTVESGGSIEIEASSSVKLKGSAVEIN